MRHLERIKAIFFSDGSVMMLEADIRLKGEGTCNTDETLPVMAHDLPVDHYDITFEMWIDKVSFCII